MLRRRFPAATLAKPVLAPEPRSGSAHGPRVAATLYASNVVAVRAVARKARASGPGDAWPSGPRCGIYLSLPGNQRSGSVHLRYHDAREIAVARRAAAAIAALVVLPPTSLLGACSDKPPSGYQGYVEGEFVNVASPIAGRLDHLSVKRGDQVAVNARLFALEAVSEAAAQRQAQEQLKAAEAQLADLRSGTRAAEQDVTRAQLAQARDRRAAHADQLARDEAQFEVGGIARAQLDDARSAHAAAQARVRSCAASSPSRNFRAAPSRSRRRPRKWRPRARRSSRPPGSSTRSRSWRPQAGRVFDTLLPRRRMGGGGQSRGAGCCRREREGALLRAAGDRRQPGPGARWRSSATAAAPTSPRR